MNYAWIGVLVLGVVAFILGGGRIVKRADHHADQQMSERWRRGVK